MEGSISMSNGGEFRTALFGGYNRDDVREYLQEIERNAEMAKNEYQKEIMGLKSKLQKAEEGKGSTDSGDYERWMKELQECRQENEDLKKGISGLETENHGLRESLAKAEAENQALAAVQENTGAAECASASSGINEEEYMEKLSAQEKEYENLKQEYESLKHENEDLRQETEGLKSDNAMLSDKKQSMEAELEELRNAAAVVEDSSSLQEEIQKMRQEKEKYESDCKAISQVLEDARAGAQNIREEAEKKADGILSEAEKKAGNIIEEAQKKAEGILERAKKDREKIFDEWKGQIDKDLENKGIRLMAAKYKIDACREEVNLAQQKLFSLYADMGKLVEGMPKRLEQLWDNDTRFASHAASVEEDDSTVIDEDKA